MDSSSKKMDRFRPDATPGGMDASLFVAQQDEKSDPRAVQKHHEALIARQPNICPFFVKFNGRI